MKSRVGLMLGFKRFGNAATVITGIELARKLRKGQFKLHRLIKRAPGDVHDRVERLSRDRYNGLCQGDTTRRPRHPARGIGMRFSRATRPVSHPSS